MIALVGLPTLTFYNQLKLKFPTVDNSYQFFESDHGIVKFRAPINSMYLDDHHSGLNNNGCCCFITVIITALALSLNYKVFLH